MPKAKSHKGLLKRIRVTGRKKVTFHKANSGHLRSGKPGKKLMTLRQKSVAKRGDIRRLEKMLQMQLLPADAPRIERPRSGEGSQTTSAQRNL